VHPAGPTAHQAAETDPPAFDLAVSIWRVNLQTLVFDAVSSPRHPFTAFVERRPISDPESTLLNPNRQNQIWHRNCTLSEWSWSQQQ
jgi:hypothetical protein